MSEEQQPYKTTHPEMITQEVWEAIYGKSATIAYARIHPQDLETIKQYIALQVHAALQPAMPGLPDVYHFIRVEAIDQDGKKWKGTLYGIEENNT